MPSNADLTKEILKIAPATAVDGLKNAQLEALLASLKATEPVPPALLNTDSVVFDSDKAAKEIAVAEAERVAKAEAEAKKQADAQAAANAASEAAAMGNATHKCVDGKAVSTLRGIVSSDDPEWMGCGRVSARDFQLKEADIERMVSIGVLVKL